MIRALRRLVRRCWLRFRIWETEAMIRDIDGWLEETPPKLAQLRDRLGALRIDQRLNEIQGERRYRAMSRFDGRETR
jgi:hypothetical protein